MKQVLPFLILIGLSTQLLSKWMIVANYILHKESITANYCENKNKPKMACHGKCHLKKQLKAQDEKESKNGPTEKNSNEIQWFYLNTLKSFIFPVSVMYLPNWKFHNGLPSPNLNSVFHPPSS